MSKDTYDKQPLTRSNLANAAKAFIAEIGDQSVRDGLPGDVQSLMSEYEFGIIMLRTALPIKSRMTVWLTAVCMSGATRRVPSLVEQARAVGFSDVAISEVFIQCMIYAGFAKVTDAFEAANLGDVTFPEVSPHEDLEAASLKIRTHLHGARKETGYSDPGRKHFSDLYRIAAEFGYGAIWSRPGLSFKERQICALAAMVCESRAAASLGKFSNSLLDHGADEHELSEIVIQAVPFIGFPAAFTALDEICSALSDG